VIERRPNPAWWRRKIVCVIPMRLLLTPISPEQRKKIIWELRWARLKKWWMQFPSVNYPSARGPYWWQRPVLLYIYVRNRFAARKGDKIAREMALVVREVDKNNPDYIAMSRLISEITLDEDITALRKQIRKQIDDL
jgi:hypothetical protein